MESGVGGGRPIRVLRQAEPVAPPRPYQLGHGRGEGVRHLRRRQNRAGGGGGKAHLARELVATPGHRLHEVAVRAEHLAQRGELKLEIVLFDDPVRPDGAHQLVFAEHTAASVDEGHERIERSPAEADQPAIDKDVPAITGPP